MTYKLFTDSSADLPLEVIEKYKITVVPLSVRFSEEEYFDLTPKEFYDKLELSETLPITSQVTPESFMNAFKKELDQGNKIICVTIGSNASGTFQSAGIAKEALETEDITLIDSNSLCLGTGMIVIKIGKMLEKGEVLEAILGMVNFHTNNRIEHLFCVDTLKYLKKGGRIKASKAVIAEVLNIKPVLVVEDALTVPFGKVRGRNKVISYYVDHIKNTIDYEKSDLVIVGHSQDRPFADKMVEALKRDVGYNGEIIIGEIGAIIGTHAGPGVLAVFYVKK
ncbi:MAG: DegV family protein [Firmicutes bacterium HGW-Firmicutes-1]|jgi:DegV family protein with EDD domain|nr:MAG: DegV family protein [Firmicutes bacterium HGW-Firmicutes-1]